MITRQNWSQWSALLDEALDLEGDARAQWLRELRLRRPDAAEALTRLLERDDPLIAGRHYERSLHAALTADDDNADAAKPGQSFGPWQVSRKLGSGGMGEVWLATRADRLYQGQAAIKLLANGGDTRRLGARFARERNLLARLTHAGIARLLDAGVADGQPYLVLEYVDGETLLDYAICHAPTLISRLHLVIAIGRAVEYAHSRLIVHRDLKPSNVVVTADGEIKLLDFGIATLLDDSDDDEASLTRLHGRGLTLDYAAPEQIAGDATGVGCDVYSLGVMLFELLTGTKPLRGERPGRTSLEYAVLHSEAPRLSHALALPLPADASPGSRPQDARRVDNALEAVVAKALRKQPGDRYPTMSAFIADLEHWLGHRPVTAARDDWRYRSRLWLRRNRVATGLALAIVVALVGGLATTLWQWQRALAAAHKAEAVQGFLVSLFEAPNNWQSGEGEPTVRKIVEDGAQRVEQELAGQPDVQLTLERVLLSTYQALGDYHSAEALARRALELCERTQGRDSDDRAQLLNALANLVLDAGRFDEAAALFEEALRILRLRWGDDSLEVADLLNDLAAVEASRGRLAESVRMRREALRVFEKDKNASPSEVERIRSDYALALDRAGQWREAEASYRLTQSRLASAPNTLRYSSYAHNLGTLESRLGHYAESERHLREAIDIRRRDADGHPYLALSLSNYAQLLDDIGRTAEARKAVDESLAILRAQYGDDSAAVARTELRLALILAHGGETAKAEAIARAALPKLGAQAPIDTARAHRTLGEILLLQQRTPEALREFQQSSALSQRLQGVQHPEAAMTVGLIGITQARLGLPSAADSLQRAISVLASKVDSRHVMLLRLRAALDAVNRAM